MEQKPKNCNEENCLFGSCILCANSCTRNLNPSAIQENQTQLGPSKLFQFWNSCTVLSCYGTQLFLPSIGGLCHLLHSPIIRTPLWLVPTIIVCSFSIKKNNFPNLICVADPGLAKICLMNRLHSSRISIILCKRFPQLTRYLGLPFWHSTHTNYQDFIFHTANFSLHAIMKIISLHMQMFSNKATII